MVQYVQDNIPGIDEAIAMSEQKDIDEETRQMHLAREFVRYGKWAKWCKDPEFKRRYGAAQIKISRLMGHMSVK
ncbi:MAG: hypothetical protein II938_02790 [Alphaproteobacteria bacterium]|nr:hypothetical protein [Alphaproteobacteria bacterium]